MHEIVHVNHLFYHIVSLKVGPTSIRVKSGDIHIGGEGVHVAYLAFSLGGALLSNPPAMEFFLSRRLTGSGSGLF